MRLSLITPGVESQTMTTTRIAVKSLVDLMRASDMEHTCRAHGNFETFNANFQTKCHATRLIPSCGMAVGQCGSRTTKCKRFQCTAWRGSWLARYPQI